MKILIVGAGLVAYGCAYSALQEECEIHIIDHSIEFGLPNVWPSLLLDHKSIPLSFSTDQQFEGIDSAFRHEWIMKGMNIQLVKKGVQFSNRTRVVSTTKNSDERYEVVLTGAGQINGIVTYDKIIDTTQDTWIPWAKPHKISNSTHSYKIERKEATGFVHLQSHSSKFNDSIYQINRQDGLSESWYSGKHESNNRKVIEIITTMLPLDHALWDCSQRFQNGMDLWEKL